MADNGLIIFIKNPELGKVKKRLAVDVGDAKALNIYRALLEHTRNLCLEVNCYRFLYYFQELKEDDEWLIEDFLKRKQPKGDLGEKMSDAFGHVLHSHSKAVIIGSDCPQISSSIINKAFTSLNNCDLVIGPTFDGGYYLLGMKSMHSDLFEDIEWSTDRVFKKTISKAKKIHLDLIFMPELSDVDYKEDWDKYGWEI